MFRNLLLVPVAAAVCTALPMPSAAHEKLPRKLAELSPADFARKVRIDDDPLAPAVTLSTRDGYTRTRSIKGALADDVHLQARIDRRTGRVTWQVWHELAYVGGQRDLNAVHYGSQGNLLEAKPLLVEHRLDRCPPVDAVGSCGQAVRVAFEVPERTIREIAGTYRPGNRTPWRLRFTDAQGREMIGGLAPAEVAGLLHAVEARRNSGT